jgi:hypothetical protein
MLGAGNPRAGSLFHNHRSAFSFRRLERMAASHPIAEIQTGILPDCDAARLPEFSAQKAAREAHRNEQALARTRLRLSRRPIFDASGKPHFGTYWPVMRDGKSRGNGLLAPQVVPPPHG